jgi:hypothetical protein
MQALAEELAPIASEQQYAGHTLKQVFREKSIAIYARALPNREPHELELVVIRRKPEATTPSGVLMPEREGYPTSNEWGRFGWSFPIRELARRMVFASGPFGSWVREQVSFYKRHKRLPDPKIV